MEQEVGGCGETTRSQAQSHSPQNVKGKNPRMSSPEGRPLAASQDELEEERALKAPSTC